MLSLDGYIAPEMIYESNHIRVFRSQRVRDALPVVIKTSTSRTFPWEIMGTLWSRPFISARNSVTRRR